MYDLRHAVRSAVNAINPDIPAILYASTGYTTDASYQQHPTYTSGTNVYIQYQAIPLEELETHDGVNRQTFQYRVWIFGDILSVDRRQAKGGDLLVFSGATWLVGHIEEEWPTWSSVLVNETLIDPSTLLPSPPSSSS